MTATAFAGLCFVLARSALELSIFLPGGLHPSGADDHAISAASPADHDTLDPLTLSFGALERNAHKSFEFWCCLARDATRMVENIIDISGDIPDGYTEETSVRY
jgi:hypothetical protein